MSTAADERTNGPAVRPITVRCVRDLCRAVDVPVVAVGGLTTGRDVVEMNLVGATTVAQDEGQMNMNLVLPLEQGKPAQVADGHRQPVLTGMAVVRAAGRILPRALTISRVRGWRPRCR